MWYNSLWNSFIVRFFSKIVFWFFKLSVPYNFGSLSLIFFSCEHSRPLRVEKPTWRAMFASGINVQKKSQKKSRTKTVKNEKLSRKRVVSKAIKMIVNYVIYGWRGCPLRVEKPTWASSESAVDLGQNKLCFFILFVMC